MMYKPETENIGMRIFFPTTQNEVKIVLLVSGEIFKPLHILSRAPDTFNYFYLWEGE